MEASATAITAISREGDEAMAIDGRTSQTMSQRPEPYERGQILSGPEAEARKSTQGRRMVQERVLAQGRDSIYNMTGLVRAFPLDPEDLPSLENQFTFYTHFLGRAEELAIKYTGANTQDFSAVMCNRVTSAMLAIMLGTIQREDHGDGSSRTDHRGTALEDAGHHSSHTVQISSSGCRRKPCNRFS